jgi:hypothetical protein
MGNIRQRLGVGAATVAVVLAGLAAWAARADAIAVAPTPVTAGPVTVTVGASATPTPDPSVNANVAVGVTAPSVPPIGAGATIGASTQTGVAGSVGVQPPGSPTPVGVSVSAAPPVVSGSPGSAPAPLPATGAQVGATRAAATSTLGSTAPGLASAPGSDALKTSPRAARAVDGAGARTSSVHPSAVEASFDPPRSNAWSSLGWAATRLGPWLALLALAFVTQRLVRGALHDARRRAVSVS